MKRQYGKITQRLAALMLGVFLILSSVAHAADNTAIGDVNDVDGDLVDSNTFTLNVSTPTLVKAAFLAGGGAALTSGSSLPSGTSIDFLIYLVNEAAIDIVDVGIQDTLAAGFTYTAGTIRVLSTTASSVCTDPAACTPAQELTIYTDVQGETALSDSPGNDAASLNGGIVEVGNNGLDTTNASQNADALTILAVVFKAVLN